MIHLKSLLITLLAICSINASEEVPTQEEVAKIYVATLKRAPDALGLDYWVSRSGLNLSQIGKSFFDQPETKALYPENLSDRDFIGQVYQNLFSRTPDSDGWNYWENELNNTINLRSSFIQTVINGAQNNEFSNDGIILDNKTIVGLSFAEAGLDNVNDAKSIISSISDDKDTVTSAITSFGIELFSKSYTDLEIFFELSYPISSISIAKETYHYIDKDTFLINIKDTFTTPQPYQDIGYKKEDFSFYYSIIMKRAIGNTFTGNTVMKNVNYYTMTGVDKVLFIGEPIHLQHDFEIYKEERSVNLDLSRQESKSLGFSYRVSKVGNASFPAQYATHQNKNESLVTRSAYEGYKNSFISNYRSTPFKEINYENSFWSKLKEIYNKE